MPTVAILAGGTATRMRPITEKIPKAMLIVAGEPFIAHQLSLLRDNGIKKAVICSGYLSGQIEDFVGDGSKFGLSVTFSCDGEKLLGTGGALRKALPLLGEKFFVIYGDSYLTADFADIYEHFCACRGTGLMTVYRNRDAWDSSNIVFKDGQIITYDKNKKNPEMEYIDYGMGILKSSAFESFPDREVFDLSELYRLLVSKGQMCGYEVEKRFYEIGSLNGLAETESYILNLLKKTGAGE